MAVFECKMCGGTLDISGNEKVVECDYCGTKQTLPNLDNEKRLRLFNRASHFRQSCAFDKAAQIYENIVQETPDDAEAHWSLVLCRYGIEYVEDPNTFDRIPTCHRASFDSILDDVDYLEAVKKADPVAVDLYKKEAAKIDRIQKDILAISSKEKPFDVFICYKETDDRKQRTLDSVKAQEIYDALTDKGYKVFFSRITLEDKLGQEYEPYIFAALNSAKVMLVIGTRPEYVNAVWVKNEWSRYLKIMAKEKGRYLIPCYLNMNPYDLPDEFKNLQGQDMSKIGFIQDLVRGIGKIIPRQTAQPQQSAPVQQGVVASFESLMKRIDIFLEQGDYDNAAKTCDKILDADPENADAYIKKLLVEGKVSSLEELAKSDADFLEDSNFKMALRFGGERVEQQVFGSNPSAAFSYYTKNGDYDKFMEYAKKYIDSLPGKAIMNALKKFKGEHGDMLEALIDLGMDPDMTFEWGGNGFCQKGTIAHYVYNDDNIYDKLSYLKVLIERGADVNKMLFTHNDEPEEYEDMESDCTLLALAAGETIFYSSNSIDKRKEEIKYLIEKGADTKKVCITLNRNESHTEYTALGRAFTQIEDVISFETKKQMMSAMLESGVTFEECYTIIPADGGEPRKVSFVEAIIETDHLGEEYYDLLKELGYDFSKDPCPAVYHILPKYIFYLRNGDKNSQKSYRKTLEHIIKLGMDPNVPYTSGNTIKTPLYVASDAHCPEAARLLLENGADPNKLSGGESPLSAVIKWKARNYETCEPNGDAEKTAELLLKTGADPNGKVTDKFGAEYTYMQYLFCSRAIPVEQAAGLISLLVEHGADPNIKRPFVFDKKIESNWQYAASHKKHKYAITKCSYEESLLDYTITEVQSPAFVETLLKAGADPNGKRLVYTRDSGWLRACKDPQGLCEIRTMLDIAIETIYEIEMENDHSNLKDSTDYIHLTEIIKLLINNGASWDNEFQCMVYGKPKKAVLRKVKFDKFFILSNRTDALLKSLGWKPGLFG